MVSGISSFLRPRRDRQNNNGKNKEKVIIQVTAAEDNAPMSSTSTVQEIVIESPTIDDEIQLPNGEGKTIVIETNESVNSPSSLACPVNLNKFKEAIEDLPPEVKETARYSGLVISSLFGLFFTVVFYRYLRHIFVPEENGWFCWMFAGPFSPMFDALCHPQRDNIFIEISRESQQLAGEVTHEVGNLFHSVIDGFSAFGTIFSYIFGAAFESAQHIFHELTENVGENVAHLLHAIEQFVSFLFHLISGAFVGLAGSVAGAFAALKEQLGIEERSSFW